MNTLTLLTGQASPVTYVPAGSRITMSGSGSIEWTPGTLNEADQNPSWKTWALGSTAGYKDTLRPLCIRVTATGSCTVTVSEGEADKYGEDAYWEEDAPYFTTDASGNVTGLMGPGGTALYGQMTDGSWMKCPPIFRLRLTGTGTVTLDAKDALGNITTGVASYTVSGATDQIEFPYAGDNAVAIRATLTGTATAEVI